MRLSGVIGILIGAIITGAAMTQQEYIWLIGSLPLVCLGLFLTFHKPNNVNVALDDGDGK